jgi:hypothetical protein
VRAADERKEKKKKRKKKKKEKNKTNGSAFGIRGTNISVSGAPG